MGAGLKWLGWSFMALGGFVLLLMIADIARHGDFSQAAGVVVPLLFFGAGGGLLRLGHKVETDPAFDLPDVAKWVFMSVGAVMIVAGAILSFDDLGALFLIFMGAVFAGAGWFAGGVMATPEGKKKVFAESASASVERAFDGAGVVRSGTYIEISEDATDDEMRAAVDRWRQSMMERHPGWAEGRIASNTAASSALWVIPVIMILIGAFLLSGVLGGDQILVFMGSIGVLVGLFFLWTLFQRWRHLRVFGASVLVLVQSPVPPGAELIGALEAPAPRNRFADGKFILTADCKQIIRSEGVSERVNGVSERVNYETTTLWSEERTVFASGETALSVKVRFDLPAGLPEATLTTSAAAQVRWSLRAEAKGAALDFNEVFDLPVLRVSGD